MSNNPDPRLDEIEAAADGLTDLCPEYLRQSIRHVQRNCDIECNEHPNGDPWDACKQPERYDGERMAAALASIPYLLAELRKAREALSRVGGLADELATQSDGRGLDYSDDDFDRGWHGANRAAVDQLRAAVAAVKGDERG